MFHHSRHHHHKAAARVSLSAISTLINLRFQTMQVNLTWTTPTTRADGSSLSLSEILTTNVKRNGTTIGSPTALTGFGAMAFSDTSPLKGSNVYTVETVTTDSLTSQPSNSVTVEVTAAGNAASAISDLAATLVP